MPHQPARLFLLLAASIMAANIPVTLTAQHPPSRQYQSVEVRPDRSVTFRILAPQAAAVVLRGEIAEDGPALQKTENGLWTVTVGPVKPDLYCYYFEVDGVRTLDPQSSDVRIQDPSPENLVDVPGDAPAIHTDRDVPHGAVVIERYRSSTLAETRSVYVYLPPGYMSTTAAYPVLYLLHGAGGYEGSWWGSGRIDRIMDNLIADAKAVPMIVVMPNGHARPLDRNALAPTLDRNITAFAGDLFTDIMPLVERHYRVRAGRESRAIAGLSMGGGQAVAVGLKHLDRFAWLGAFSAAVHRMDFEARFPELVQDPAPANDRIRLLWIACGRDDLLYAANSEFSAALARSGLRHTYMITHGGHNWLNWRPYLAEFASNIFRPENP